MYGGRVGARRVEKYAEIRDELLRVVGTGDPNRFDAEEHPGQPPYRSPY